MTTTIHRVNPNSTWFFKCHWQEQRKLKLPELIMDTHHEISCHLICHPVMTWVMSHGTTNAPLVMSTLNWDKRDPISWNAATAWRHRRCPLKRQQDGNAEVSMQQVSPSANFTKFCQFIIFFFSITVCVKQWDEGVATVGSQEKTLLQQC